MNKTTMLEAVEFQLKGIKTEQFALLADHYNPSKETGFKTQFQFKIHAPSQQIGVFGAFEFIQGKQVFMKIEISCHFFIGTIAWKGFQQSEGKFLIPKGFMAHLAMITTGTCRGVLFAKTEGSEFSKFIIPTLNVAEVIKEDGEFEG